VSGGPAGRNPSLTVSRAGDWIEIQRWNRSDHSDKDIKVFICAELDVLNRSAGIMQDHACELDKGKFLKFAQMSLIATAVQVAPLQTGSELLRNVQDSPTKVIDHKNKKSVDQLMLKSRSEIMTVTLDGVTVLGRSITPSAVFPD
jgi:hypothetical protein